MTVSERIPIQVSAVKVADRLRAIDPDYVSLLAASIDQRGLMQPVEVREPDKQGRHALVAGAHRLAAVKSLGWTEIEAVILSVDKVEARLREIDENLFRRELSALDRGVFLLKRQEIYEARYPEAAGRAASAHARWHASDRLSFASDTEERLGINKRSIQRAMQRASRIPEDVRAKIASTWIAMSGVELDALARLEPDEQRRSVALMLASAEDRPRHVAAAVARVRGVVPAQRAEDDEQLAALMAAWRKAGAVARRRFVDFLESEGKAPTPVPAIADAA